jgi:EAL domain-containing protein (putative c-di-GMP-specific phosphodiesterase class I)
MNSQRKNEARARGGGWALMKKAWPAFAGCAFAFLLGGVLLPVEIAYDWTIPLYLTAGLIALAAAGLIVLIALELARYGKTADESLAQMASQLDDFGRGDVKYVSTRHHHQALDDFQGVLNRALNSYSSLRFIYRTSEADRAFDEKIAAGVVLGFPEFVDRLPHEIERNANFRSAVVFVKSLGEGAGDPSPMRDLHEALMEAFPSSLIGLYDDATFVLYDRDVSSFRALRETLERLVGSYKSMKVARGADIASIAYCKAGASVYPYVPLTSLVDEGLAELRKSEGVSITSDVSKVYYPHAILTEDNKRIVYFATVESFEGLFDKAKTYSSAVQALRKYANWLAAQVGFTATGFLSYYPETEQYDLVFEGHRDPASASFSKLGVRIKQASIDPFYREALNDAFFASCDAEELPPSLSGPLMNLGVASFCFFAVHSGEEKRGFVYFTSLEKRAALSMLEREMLSRYASLASSFIVSAQEKSKTAENSAVIEALSDRTGKYIYSLDRTSHRLTYLSRNLKRAYPEAKEGDLCYKALRGEGSPCSHCPLSHGVDHRIIERISSTECAISALIYKGVRKGQSTILIEDTGRENVKSSNRFLDPSLLVRNREALALDLSRQLKQRDSGYVLGLRLLNHEELIKKATGSDAASIMEMVAKSIRDAGYGDIVYRLGDFELLFLLKSYQKNKILGLVEEVAEITKGPFDYQLIKLEPEYSYCFVGYPGEAQTPREIVSLVESELNRSEGFGPGQVVQVADNHPRFALREDYVDDLLSKTLARDVVPIAIQPLYQANTKKIASIDVFARLFTASGDQIPSGELFAAAGRKKILEKVDLGALWSAGKFIDDHDEDALSKSSIEFIGVRLGVASIKNPDFVLEVKRFFGKYALPKRYLHFLVDVRVCLENKESVKAIMADLSPYGIVWEGISANEENVSLDEMKALGIGCLRSEMSLISRAATNSKDYQAISRFVYAATRAGFRLACCGIETEEERQIAEHLEFPLLSGYYLSEPLSENDFLQTLAFAK